MRNFLFYIPMSIIFLTNWLYCAVYLLINDFAVQQTRADKNEIVLSLFTLIVCTILSAISLYFMYHKYNEFGSFSVYVFLYFMLILCILLNLALNDWIFSYPLAILNIFLLGLFYSNSMTFCSYKN